MIEEEKDASEFFKEVEQEGGKAFEETTEEKETPTESSTEEKPAEETPSSEGKEESKEKVEDSKEESKEQTQEKPLPFDQHPSWIKRIDENRELKEELADLKEGIDKDKAQRDEQTQNKNVPSWFSSQFGDDPKAWQEFQAHEASRDERLMSRIHQNQEDVVKKQQQETDKWTGWVDDQVSTLQSEGKQFDKNELLKLIGDIRPTDEKGNLDFHKGFELLEERKSIAQAKKTVKTQEKKEVAAQTMDEGKGEPEEKKFLNSRDLQNQGWSDLISQ